MKKTACAAALLAVLAAGSTACATSGPSKYEAETAIDQAVAATKKAGSVDGEWRDTGKIIKKAKAAMEKGDMEKAIKLANTAKFQGETGYAQAVAQKDVKPPAF
jgi:hypothetical protein